MPKFTPNQVQQWWSKVLERDEVGRTSDETEDAAYARRVRCVFCNQDLVAPLRRSLGSGQGAALLAYWHDQGTFIASGLRCFGRSCQVQADGVGWILEMHAERLCGSNAFGALSTRVLDNPNWNGSALRRMVLLCKGLSKLPSPRGAWARTL